MAVTLHDVARLAGVSIKTVSNVVHEYLHVRVTTRERVLTAIGELGYTPNFSARSLKSGRTGVIGLAVPELSLSYFAELSDAVIRAADRHGVTVLLLSVVATWNNFFLPLAVLSDPNLLPVTVGLNNWQALSNAGAGGEQVWNLIVTGAFVSILPLIIAFLSLQKYWQGGLPLGALK